MRYAPTHFRELFCETGIVWASSPPWRAYAIRPYTFSLIIWGNGNRLGLPAAMEGVCDTPLQFLAEKLVKWELVMPPSPP